MSARNRTAKAKRRRATGRPSKFTPKAAAQVLASIAAGLTRQGAANLVGVSRETLHDWARRFPDFADKLREADAKAELQHTVNLASAARQGKWGASAFWLERRRAQDYGRVDRHFVANADLGGTTIPPNYLAAIRRALGVDVDAAPGPALPAGPEPAPEPDGGDVLPTLPSLPPDAQLLPPVPPPPKQRQQPPGITIASGPRTSFPVSSGPPGEWGRR